MTIVIRVGGLLTSNQYSRYEVANSKYKLNQDSNEVEVPIDSNYVKIYDYVKRQNIIIQGENRGERSVHNCKSSLPTLSLHSIRKATVHSVHPFGISVQIEGYQDHGLVPISEVSNNEVINFDGIIVYSTLNTRFSIKAFRVL